METFFPVDFMRQTGTSGILNPREHPEFYTVVASIAVAAAAGRKLMRMQVAQQERTRELLGEIQ
jgi:hypothetical protein